MCDRGTVGCFAHGKLLIHLSDGAFFGEMRSGSVSVLSSGVCSAFGWLVCLFARPTAALWRGSLLTGQTRTATIIAQTHCSCFRVSKTAFDSVLTKCAPHPNIPPQHTAHKVASASSAGAAHRRGPAGHARVAVERAFLPGPSSLPLRTAAAAAWALFFLWVPVRVVLATPLHSAGSWWRAVVWPEFLAGRHK